MCPGGCLVERFCEDKSFVGESWGMAGFFGEVTGVSEVFATLLLGSEGKSGMGKVLQRMEWGCWGGGEWRDGAT